MRNNISDLQLKYGDGDGETKISHRVQNYDPFNDWNK